MAKWNELKAWSDKYLPEIKKHLGEYLISEPENKTELTKIIEGWGDYLFYGFANENNLSQWFIGDLKAFRLWFNKELFKLPKGELPGEGKSNLDGSSDFRAFDKNKIPNFIVTESVIKDELQRLSA